MISGAAITICMRTRGTHWQADVGGILVNTSGILSKGHTCWLLAGHPFLSGQTLTKPLGHSSPAPPVGGPPEPEPEPGGNTVAGPPEPEPGGSRVAGPPEPEPGGRTVAVSSQVPASLDTLPFFTANLTMKPPMLVGLAAPEHFLSQEPELCLGSTRPFLQQREKEQLHVFFPTFTLSSKSSQARMDCMRRRKPSETSEALMVKA